MSALAGSSNNASQPVYLQEAVGPSVDDRNREKELLAHFVNASLHSLERFLLRRSEPRTTLLTISLEALGRGTDVSSNLTHLDPFPLLQKWRRLTTWQPLHRLYQQCSFVCEIGSGCARVMSKALHGSDVVVLGVSKVPERQTRSLLHKSAKEHEKEEQSSAAATKLQREMTHTIAASLGNNMIS